MDQVLDLQGLPVEPVDDALDEEEGLPSGLSIWMCGGVGLSTISIALCQGTVK